MESLAKSVFDYAESHLSATERQLKNAKTLYWHTKLMFKYAK
jgi:hypothetical protein